MKYLILIFFYYVCTCGYACAWEHMHAMVHVWRSGVSSLLPCGFQVLNSGVWLVLEALFAWWAISPALSKAFVDKQKYKWSRNPMKWKGKYITVMCVASSLHRQNKKWGCLLYINILYCWQLVIIGSLRELVVWFSSVLHFLAWFQW